MEVMFHHQSGSVSTGEVQERPSTL